MNQKSKTDSYKRFARFYDYIIGPLNKSLKEIAFSLYQPDSDTRILDIGCGTGSQLKLYQQSGCQTFGIDVSFAMLRQAQKNLKNNTRLFLANGTFSPFKKEQFDLILMTTVLHEMPEDVRIDVLLEAKNIIKKSGYILITDFNPGNKRSLKSWYSRLIINIAEMSAGGEHYINFKQFIRNGGLLKLIKQSDLVIKKKKIVAGGNIALYLLSK